MKAVRQLEQIICKDVRTEPVQHLRKDLCELTQTFGEREFRGSSERQSCSHRPMAGLFLLCLFNASQGHGCSRLACLTKNRANSHIGVLQIRRSVPVQRKHLFPRKNIICRPILREIRVFHGTDADLLSDISLFIVAQIRIFFVDDFSGAFACFLKKLAQWYVFTRARLHQFAVFAKDAAKYDVAQISGVTFSPGYREDLFEMQSEEHTSELQPRF